MVRSLRGDAMNSILTVLLVIAGIAALVPLGWTIRFTEDIAPADKNQLQIVPVAAGKRLDLSDPASKGKTFQWQCGGANGNTTVPAEWRPQECK